MDAHHTKRIVETGKSEGFSSLSSEVRQGAEMMLGFWRGNLEEAHLPLWSGSARRPELRAATG